MKVECLLEKLKQGLVVGERMTGKNLTLPILSALHISTKESSLIIRATNLNIGIEYTLPVKVIEPGEIVVPAHLFVSSLQGIEKDQPITLTSEEGNLLLSYKGGRMMIKCLPSEDFPTLPQIESVHVFSVPSRDFIEGARSVVFAAAQTDIKPELSSVFIHMRDDHLVFVATDAFRLAEKKIRVKNTEQFPDILIPAKNLVEILKALPDSKDLITFSITENQFSCIIGGVYITSRLTSGNYPDYRMIIPKESKTECIALRSDLQNLLKTLSVFSDRDSRIDVALHPSEKSCSFSSRNNDVGEATHSILCTLKGDDVDIRVNQKHFQDALSNLSVDSASISCTESNKPIIIRGVGDTSFLYLMMPLSR